MSSSESARSTPVDVDASVDVKAGDRLAKESDVTVGGGAVPPETEYFGFALYVGSTFVVLIYINWAFLPRSWLQAINVYYYPSRWWALACPSFLVMTLVYMYVALASYNTEVLTPTLSSLECITDLHAKVVPQEDIQLYLYAASDGVWDLPLGEVCEVLYAKP
jgi:phosphatidylinositol glycan class P protein